MSSRKYTAEERHIIRDALRDHCELCNSTRGLEIHHIIPVVCGGRTHPDNLITVCSRCHAILTPRRELTRIGINECLSQQYVSATRLEFYEKLGEYFKDPYGYACAEDCMDVFDEVMDELQRKVAKRE